MIASKFLYCKCVRDNLNGIFTAKIIVITKTFPYQSRYLPILKKRKSALKPSISITFPRR